MESACLTFGHDVPVGGVVSVPKRHPEEFRRKVLDLLAAQGLRAVTAAAVEASRRLSTTGQ